MRSRIKLILFLGLFWVLVFQCCRVFFYLYQLVTGTVQPFDLLPQAAWHGLRMDVSMAAYLLVLPTLLLAFTAHGWSVYRKVVSAFGIFAAFCVSLIVACDLPVYKAWDFRLDATPLHYLSDPTEALASASASPLLLLTILFLTLFAGMAFLYHRILIFFIAGFRRTRFYFTVPLFLLLGGLLIVPIRGGLQLAPMNQSTVYFSNVSFANQMAINAPWNFFNSLVYVAGSKKNDFIVMETAVADSLLSDLRSQSNGQRQLVKPGIRPNVVFIIWESFTAKVVGALGGRPGVTPEFGKLAEEGVLFTNMYASGDRSDKGLIAILSGYPAQPTTSIIKKPTKTASLPSIPNYLRQRGYATSFYYGGETEFANIKSYLLQNRFERVIDRYAFQESDMNSKWGAHDHVVFERFLQDLDKQSAPFFSVLFTLSSHEPFEVPVATVFAGESPEQKFLNSLHYADASLGDFIRAAKTKSWWANTLLVVVADHGHPMPQTPGGKPPQHRIPMLWLGGALDTNGAKIDDLGSQTDLAATLLDQMGYPSSDFRWSNDLLRRGRTPYAFFSFNNGFGWMTPGGQLVYDNVGQLVMSESRNSQPLDRRRGQAYQQILVDDYIAR